MLLIRKLKDFGDMGNSLSVPCAGETCKTKLKKKKMSLAGDDDHALYETIGAAYIANQAKGMGTSEAWDAAV